MKGCATLLIIATLATTNCAGPMVLAKGPASEPAMPGVDSDPEDEWFAAIPFDRCDPPLDGLFMSWGNARKYVIHERKQEAEAKIRMLDMQEALGVAIVQRDAARKVADDSFNGVGAFLQHWGLPIGVVLGVIGGTLAAVAIGGHK